MLIASLIMTMVFLAVIWIAALGGPRWGYVGPICLSLAGVAWGFCAGGLVMLLVALFVGVVAIACGLARARRSTFYLGSLTAFTIAFGIVIGFFVVPEQREWAALERAYPVESLEERLPEIKRVKQSDNGQKASIATLQQLDSLERSLGEINWDTQRREMSLRHIHAGAVERFIQSRGFGAARMITAPTPSAVQINEPEPISMPVYDISPRDGRPEDMHDESLLSFLNPRTFGYVEDLRHVTGFQPHAFQYAPSAPRTWHIDKLELVGLLKHEEPAVYLSEHLPRMSELRDASTRPLDDFESKALPALQKGEDIQVSGIQ